MIKIGTSGYSYDDWRGVVYPESLSKKNFLKRYSSYFDLTEINSTYYHLPTPGMFENIRKKVPEEFRFVVKFSKELTHEREKAAKSVDKFRAGIEPLVQSGQLVTTLAQFPYSFKPKDESFEHLEFLRNQLPELPINVEFRNEYWIKEETFKFLEKHDLGYVCVDMPRLPRLVPPIVRATTDLGYIRFHGRVEEHWWNPPNPHMRYDYSYGEEELEEWVDKTEELKDYTENIVILFNNHYGGKSARDAKKFSGLLGLEGGTDGLPEPGDLIQPGKDLFET
ncbi:MAG: DUF72 domain-containing protein [Candidatus Acetothermia bacterium]